MTDDDGFSLELLEPIHQGNELFHAAVACIALEPTFAAHLLRLWRAGVSIRTVSAADLRALLSDLGRVVTELASEALAKVTVAALRRLLEACREPSNHFARTPQCARSDFGSAGG